jgi:hypothetical protein
MQVEHASSDRSKGMSRGRMDESEELSATGILMSTSGLRQGIQGLD